MLTRGILALDHSVRVSQGSRAARERRPQLLKDLSNEAIAMDIEDAVRLNAAAVAVQVFIGGEDETQSIHNMTRLVDAGSPRTACRCWA